MISTLPVTSVVFANCRVAAGGRVGEGGLGPRLRVGTMGSQPRGRVRTRGGGPQQVCAGGIRIPRPTDVSAANDGCHNNAALTLFLGQFKEQRLLYWSVERHTRRAYAYCIHGLCKRYLGTHVTTLGGRARVRNDRCVCTRSDDDRAQMRNTDGSVGVCAREKTTENKNT